METNGRSREGTEEREKQTGMTRDSMRDSETDMTADYAAQVSTGNIVTTSIIGGTISALSERAYTDEDRKSITKVTHT